MKPTTRKKTIYWAIYDNKGSICDIAPLRQWAINKYTDYSPEVWDRLENKGYRCVKVKVIKQKVAKK